MFPYIGVFILMIQCSFTFADKDSVLVPEFDKNYIYSEEHDAFYKLLPRKQDWFEAFTACTLEQSRLAFPRTNDEASYLWQLLHITGVKNKAIWVGASKINLEDEFKTVEGEDISDTYFKTVDNDMSDAVADECLEMRANNRLYKKSCFSKRRAICRKIPPDDPCPSLCIAPGYSSDPDRKSCYKVHTDIKNWNDAKLACEREGAHLLVLNSQREADYLIFLLGINKTEAPRDVQHLVSVGFNDLDNEGVYKTVDGQMVDQTGYAKWYPQEPSGKAGKGKKVREEDCGSMWRQHALLNDIDCTTVLAFVCEREIHLPVWTSK